MIRNNQEDHAQLMPIAQCDAIEYPKPDNILSFDKASSIYMSNVYHDADQPCHLHLSDSAIPLASNLADYGEPALRYCPAAVYNIVEEKK